MLLRQNLRRRHNCCLETSLRHFRRHQSRNDSFSRANISLQQPIHRMIRLQILQNLPRSSALSVRQRKRQLIDKTLHDRLIKRNFPACQSGLFLLVKLCRQYHFEQLLKRQALTTTGNFLVSFWRVKKFNRLRTTNQFLAPNNVFRQSLGQKIHNWTNIFHQILHGFWADIFNRFINRLNSRIIFRSSFGNFFRQLDGRIIDLIAIILHTKLARKNKFRIRF